MIPSSQIVSHMLMSHDHVALFFSLIDSRLFSNYGDISNLVNTVSYCTTYRNSLLGSSRQDIIILLTSVYSSMVPACL